MRLHELKSTARSWTKLTAPGIAVLNGSRPAWIQRNASLSLLTAALCFGQEIPRTFVDMEMEDAFMAEARMRRAQTAAAAYQEKQFTEHVNRFAIAFNRMTDDYSKKRILNVKLLREVRAAFSALEKDQFLPRIPAK